MLLIHGARAALRAGAVTRQPDDLHARAGALAARQGHHVAAVALAHSLARVCWRVWRDGRPLERRDPREEGGPFHGAAEASLTMATGLAGAGPSR